MRSHTHRDRERLKVSKGTKKEERKKEILKSIKPAYDRHDDDNIYTHKLSA